MPGSRPQSHGNVYHACMFLPTTTGTITAATTATATAVTTNNAAATIATIKQHQFFLQEC